MIKKYKIFKESLLNKLEGPTMEEAWKNHGYDRVFNTPEEFFLYVIDGMEIKEQTKYPESVFWEKNGKIIIEQNFKGKELYFEYSTFWKLFIIIFGLRDTEIQIIIKDLVKKHLNWNGLRPIWITNFNHCCGRISNLED